MPVPQNSIPMIGAEGPHGYISMGGMFTLLKVRRDQRPGDHRDPGDYQHPSGTVAYEFTGALPDPSRPAPAAGKAAVELKARKPSGHAGHH